MDPKKEIAETTFAVGPEKNAKAAALLFKYVMPISFDQFDEDQLYPPFLQGRFLHWVFLNSLLGAMHNAGYDENIIEVPEGDVIALDFSLHPVYGYWRVKEGFETQVSETLLDLLEKNISVRDPQISVLGSSLSEKLVPIRKAVFDHNFKDARAPIFGCELSEKPVKSLNEVLVTIENVPWIDVSDVSWDHIFEFRKDEDAAKKFRNFRLFLSSSYIGKDRQFIQDDILRRLEAVDAMCKKHGFKLQTSVMKSVVKSKFILGGGLAGLLAWLFGTSDATTILGSAALIGGVSAEIADILLDVRAAKFDLQHEINGHELAWVIKARSELQTN